MFAVDEFDDVAASDSNEREELAYRSVRVTSAVERNPVTPEHASQRSICHFGVCRVCIN